MKEYTIFQITLIDENTYSATLIDEQKQKLSVKVYKTTQNSFVARTDQDIDYELLSESGERLTSLKDYDSVYLGTPIPPDQKITV